MTSLLSGLSDLPDDWEYQRVTLHPQRTCDWEENLGHWQTTKVVRLAGNWQMLDKEPEIALMLKRYAGSGEEILNNAIYLHTLRTVKDAVQQKILQNAKRFLEGIREISLEHMVEGWWGDLPEKDLTEAQVNVILAFTRWLKNKQPAQRNLVRKLLATDDRGQLLLLPSRQALLSTPYEVIVAPFIPRPRQWQPTITLERGVSR